MKTRILVVLLVLGFGAAVRAATLNGVVLINELGGEPLENVEVDAQGANTAVSLHNGRFTLVFDASKKAGDEVQLTARKDGFVVVHYILLNQVLRADPATFTAEILMCKEGDQEEMARRFFRLKGSEAVAASYLDRLHALEAENRANAEAVKQLQADRDAAGGAARKAADDFAAQKAGQTSEMYDRAMRLFLDRKLDDALNVLDEAALQRRKAEAKQASDQVARDYDLRGRLLVLKFEFSKATEAYQSAVEASPDNFDAQFALANFLQSLNREKLALPAYQRCLDLAGRNHDEAETSAVLNNLGNLHHNAHREADARKAYEDALAIRRRLADQNPSVYLPAFAMTLNNLGNVQADEHRVPEALNSYEEALGHYRALAKQNPDTYQPDVAVTQNNLGNLYSREHQMDEARKAFGEALSIRRDLVAKDPAAYLPDLALSLNNLGALDRSENRMKEARQETGEALDIRRKLADQNPDAYLPDLAVTLNNMGNLDWTEKRMEDAHTEFSEALKYERGLADQNPGAYLPQVAQTLNNLGILDWTENRLADARKEFDEALQHDQQLADQNPAIYQPDVAQTLNNLGILDCTENRMAEGRKAFEDSLAIYTKFAATDPARYKLEVDRETALLKSVKN